MREVEGHPPDAAVPVPGVLATVETASPTSPDDSLAEERCIAAGTHLDGFFSLPGRVRIEGHASGELVVGESVVVARGGFVEGRIECPVVEIHGLVRGDVLALGRLHLHSTAELEGDVVTGRLVLDEGARVRGRIRTWPEGRPYLRLLRGGASEG